MGKPVNSSAKRLETKILNTDVNKEVYDSFKDYCRVHGYPMNMVLEIFMRQYVDGKFKVSSNDILKWKEDNSEKDLFGTSVNKEIYLQFKSACKTNGYFVKYVITAFMEKLLSGKFVLEYIEVDKNA